MFALGGSIAVLLVAFAIQMLIMAGLLWCAMKLTKVNGTFQAILLAVVISSVVGLIPYLGWLLGFVTLLFLISQWTDAEMFPSALLMVVVSWVVAMVVMGIIIMAFAQ